MDKFIVGFGSTPREYVINEVRYNKSYIGALGIKRIKIITSYIIIDDIF